MKLPFQPRPKTLTDRAQAVADDAVKFVRSVPDRLESGRDRALAVAGAAAGVAAGLAFWRSRKEEEEEGPSVHHDPAQVRTPWKTPPPTAPSTEPATSEPTAEATKKPVTSSKAAATNAAGSRSK